MHFIITFCSFCPNCLSTLRKTEYATVLGTIRLQNNQTKDNHFPYNIRLGIALHSRGNGNFKIFSIFLMEFKKRFLLFCSILSALIFLFTFMPRTIVKPLVVPSIHKYGVSFLEIPTRARCGFVIRQAKCQTRKKQNAARSVACWEAESNGGGGRL